MTFQKGKSGNPEGRLTEKVWTDAIRMALSETDSATGKRKLRQVAESLVEKAIAGDVAAMKEIGDRMEGKVAQSITGEGGGDIVIRVLTGVPRADD